MNADVFTPSEALLTTAEVSRILGVTQAAISEWCKAGDFPNAFRLNPRTRSGWRIPRKDVDAFIEKRRQQRGFFRMPVESTPGTGPLSGQQPDFWKQATAN